MQLRNEVLAFMALSRYFALKKLKQKNAYREAIEAVRVENCPEWDSHDFMSAITRTKNEMKKSGLMQEVFNLVKQGKSLYEISLHIDPSHKVNELHKKKFDSLQEEIAYHDLNLIGGPEYANEDVLSPRELELLQIEPEEHEHYLAIQQTVEMPVKKQTLRSRAKQLHLYLNQQLELNFPVRKEFQFTH